jgi:Mn2+/Fe2+ NRAMP family transporter
MFSSGNRLSRVLRSAVNSKASFALLFIFFFSSPVDASLNGLNQILIAKVYGDGGVVLSFAQAKVGSYSTDTIRGWPNYTTNGIITNATPILQGNVASGSPNEAQGGQNPVGYNFNVTHLFHLNGGSLSHGKDLPVKGRVIPVGKPNPATGSVAIGAKSTGSAVSSQVGAQFGYRIAWTMLFTYPLMSGIQEISGQIGRVTGRGIAGNLRRHYHPALLYAIVFLVLAANTINLGADIGAMGAALKLLIGGPALVYAALFSVIIVLLQVYTTYDKYSKVLKWMCLSLFAYVATLLFIHVNWAQALRYTLIPSLSVKTDFVVSIVAVLGTTISPYLFFWQAEEEVEIEKAAPKERPLVKAPSQAPAQLHRIRVDTFAGMAVSNVVAYAIIITSAAALHMHGITDIQTSTQAAEALRPIAGKFAFLLFASGIIGTGLLAVPVMAGSAAYAVGESLHWKVGLNRDPLRAKQFYAVIGVATLVGFGMNLLHFDPIKALFWSAVINGVVAVPIMFLMMFMAQNKKVMGSFTLNRRQQLLGWLATAAMTAAAIGLFATWGK